MAVTANAAIRCGTADGPHAYRRRPRNITGGGDESQNESGLGIDAARRGVTLTMEPDEALVEGARRGCADDLAALYRRYWPLAWQWAYAIVGSGHRADDVAQAAFLKAVAALPQFDPDRPFGPWLKRIVLNAAIDDIRRLRRGPVPLDWLDDLAPAASEAEARQDAALIGAIRALHPARRHVIVLHYWLELHVDEIAALLGVPYGTVASRLSRALADLRIALEEQNHVERH